MENLYNKIMRQMKQINLLNEVNVLNFMQCDVEKKLRKI